MSFSAVYAAVRVISETVASLPLIIYRRLPRGKERATSNPAYPILHDRPNDYMTSIVFRETAMVHVLLWGNAYAEVVWGGGGSVRGLYLIEPWRCKPKVIDGRLIYHVQTGYDENGQVMEQRDIDYRDIVHVPGLSFNGIHGRSVVSWARESIGLGLRSEEFGSSFFGKAARPSGVLEHPGVLAEDSAARLRDSWQRTYGSAENTGKVAVLEEGMKFNPLTIPPEDAQFLQTRKFQVEEIARWFRLPPHKIGSLDKATFSNIEHQALEFVSDTIQPWLIRWEQEINRKILGGDLFCEHLVDSLLRGDISSRYAAYATGKQNGWLSADEIRERENMNPLPDGQGEIYLVPLNMVPADAVDSVAADELPGEPTGIREILVDGLIEAMQRMVSIEVNSIRRAAKTAAAFESWRSGWYEKHLLVRREAVGVFVKAIAAMDGRPELTSNLPEVLRLQSQRSQGELMRAIDGQVGDATSTIDQMISRWESDKPRPLALELIGGA
jgi:HK97 family phage portal protein